MRKTLLSSLLALAIIFSSIAVPSYAADNEPIYERVSAETVTRGLVYEKKEILTREGWVDVHVLRMDLEDDMLSLDLLRNVGDYGVKGTVQQFVDSDSERAVAGINGSFYDTTLAKTDSVGLNYDETFFSLLSNYNASYQGAASLVRTTAGDTFIDFLSATVTAKTDSDYVMNVQGFNRQPKNSDIIIYDRGMGETTQGPDGTAYLNKIIVENGIVTGTASPKEVVSIPVDGYVITVPSSVSGSHMGNFPVGTGVTIEVASGIQQDLLEIAISGGGRILENGEIVNTGLVVDPNRRHPRTAVGLTGDGTELIAMVVDGRGESIGATHEELAGYLKAYGVTDAMHMDGGGSSTMVGTGYGDMESSVFNAPSDGVQRRILNGLGFVSLAPDDSPIHELVLEADHDKVFKNTEMTFSMKAIDEYSNGKTINSSQIAWSVQGVAGKWSGNSFTPSTSGIGKVTAYYGMHSDSITINVVDAYIDIDVQPKILRLSEGDTGEFTFMGTDATGFKGVVQSQNISYTLADDSVGTFINGKFYAKAKPGISKVTFDIDNRSLSAYVVVGDNTQPFAGFESVTFSPLAYPETVTAAAMLVDEEASEGDSSFRLDYTFEKSTVTQAGYLVFDDMVFNAPINGILVDVYGNASGHTVKAMVTDATGRKENLTLSSNINWRGWKTLKTDLPDDFVYPVTLNRLYVVALQTPRQYSGTVYFDNLMQRIDFSTDKLKFDVEQLIADPLMALTEPANAYKISLFGATFGRNRLLDNIVLSKVYREMGGSDRAIFAGGTDVDEEKLDSDVIEWGNAFGSYDTPDVKIITLATGGGGLYATDYTQMKRLYEILSGTSQNNIIILGNRSPVNEDGFDDVREGLLLHEILRDFKQKTGKNVFYVNASGYGFNVDIRDGVRYMDLNGLWYTIDSDRAIDLNRTFYIVDFYVVNHKLSYKVKNLYPLVQY